MIQENLLTQLRQLKLTGMVQALTEQLEQPPLQDQSFEERLCLLIDREYLYRNQRRVANLLRVAKLRQQATLQDIDFQHPRKLEKSQFTALYTCDFIRRHHNLLITGPTGSGKSYLACAIGHQACRLGMSVRYLRLPRFFEESTIARADGSYGKLLLQWLKTDLLILDDFGLTQELTTAQRNDLFNLIEDRHEIKSTLMISQYPIKNWHQLLGEPTLADAILDRLLSNAHRLELSGASLRKKHKEGVLDDALNK